MHAIIRAFYEEYGPPQIRDAETALHRAIARYESSLVPCPECDGEYYGPTTDPECPHPTCALCNGAGEVEEHVAAYVRKLICDAAKIWPLAEEAIVSVLQRRKEEGL